MPADDLQATENRLNIGSNTSSANTFVDGSNPETNNEAYLNDGVVNVSDNKYILPLKTTPTEEDAPSTVSSRTTSTLTPLTNNGSSSSSSRCPAQSLPSIASVRFCDLPVREKTVQIRMNDSSNNNCSNNNNSNTSSLLKRHLSDASASAAPGRLASSSRLRRPISIPARPLSMHRAMTTTVPMNLLRSQELHQSNPGRRLKEKIRCGEGGGNGECGGGVGGCGGGEGCGGGGGNRDGDNVWGGVEGRETDKCRIKVSAPRSERNCHQSNMVGQPLTCLRTSTSF